MKNSQLSHQLSTEIIFCEVNSALRRFAHQRRCVVLIDERVRRVHTLDLEGCEVIEIPSGEGSKSWLYAGQIVERMVRMGSQRDTLIVGIGGGVVTDLAGFVGSVLMRGVDVGFIPTTLLAAVDASIGGKNGVNIGGFKNMAGTIVQPKFVAIDPQLLSTLPDEEFRQGVAEAIKSGMVGDEALFRLIEGATFKELRTNSALLSEVIRRSVEVKCKIVSQDELESGARRMLNLGHTLAHAIEHHLPNFGHGNAVAVGLNYICGISVDRGLMSHAEALRVDSVLSKHGFSLINPLLREQVREGISKDKKRVGDDIIVALPASIGRCEVVPISIEEFLGDLL